MKEKILVALKPSILIWGSAKALDGVASILEKSVTDESQMKPQSAGSNSFL